MLRLGAGLDLDAARAALAEALGGGLLPFEGPLEGEEAVGAAAPTTARELVEALEGALEAAEPEGSARAPAAWLLAWAPAALSAGALLRAAVGVERSHAPVGLACVELLDAIFGGGDPGLHAANRFRAAAGAAGLALPPTRAVAFDARVRAEDVALALGPHRLGGSPEHVPEALGAQAVEALRGPPPPVARALGLPVTGDVRARVERALEALAAERPDGLARAARGAAHQLHARARWLRSLAPPAPPDPWEAMAAVVRAKAPFARGAHAALELEGRPLDAWLAGEPRALLEALWRSRWVEPGAPDESALLAATRFGGAMFAVFSDAERAALVAWLATPGPAAFPDPGRRSPPDSPEHECRGRHSSSPEHECRGRHSSSPEHECRGRHSNPPPSTPAPRLGAARERYLALLTRRDAGALAAARGSIERALADAAPSPRALASLPADGAALAAWVRARMDEQLSAPSRARRAEDALTREETVWLLLQLAPAALVDGAWLEGAVAAAPSQSTAGGLLWRIYRDELGAGVRAQHHGVVFRDTLARVGCALPDCDTRALLERPGLLPEAFELPALWLAFARAADRFWPELLGLNLAVEMAGVGETYRRASALLRRHGVDTLFFRLHDTIDNASTGHTAWSVEAIRAWEADVRAAGVDDLRPLWARLWAGHASYARASAPLVRAVLRRLAPRLGLRWARALAREALA